MKPTPQDLDNRVRVRAFSASDHEDTVAEGTMVAYSREPQISILLADGTHKWWSQSLVEIVPESFAIGTVLEHVRGGCGCQRVRLANGVWVSAQAGGTGGGDDDYFLDRIADGTYRVVSAGVQG